MDSTVPTGERAIAGVTNGLIGHGESVTWEGTHFGFRLRHTSKIVDYEPYRFFCDEMTYGAFKSFRHEHFFEAVGDETIMRDVLEFAAPFGALGLMAERLVLRDYMRRFLVERNTTIKRIAESNGWQRYLANER
ncbi:SRPBCC family protein [Edaphobacter aggregans]|uniref:SRPBCC family protein n=1 Tax=Edaphobacter aggregans TaxID=570835 RepID=UPI001FE13573|nr:SRPBCC family protein [Edaphobacter aggregans]